MLTLLLNLALIGIVPESCSAPQAASCSQSVVRVGLFPRLHARREARVSARMSARAGCNSANGCSQAKPAGNPPMTQPKAMPGTAK